MKKNKSSLYRGIAQLEFVMVLAVLVPLFLALLWSGMFGVALSNVTVSARHEVWRQRQEVRPRPFEFEDSSSGTISRSSSESIRLGTLFDGWATPKSTSSVLAGSWDHRVIKLNAKSPNRQLAIDVAKRTPEAKFDEITANLSSLNKLANLDNLIGKVLSSAVIKSLIGGFNGLKSEGMTRLEESKRRATEGKERAKQEFKGKVDTMQRELNDLKARQLLIQQRIQEAKAKRLQAKTEKERRDLQAAIERFGEEAKKLESEIPRRQRELGLLQADPIGALP